MPSQHAKYSPSAAHRWTKCPAAPHLEAGKEDRPTVAAERGTFFHAVAECMLAEGYSLHAAHRWAVGDGAKEFLTLPIEDLGDLSPEVCAEAVMPYVEFVRDLVAEHFEGLAELATEARLVFRQDPACWGTGDAVVYYRDTGGVDVVDLKTGTWGVDPHQNPQLVIYLVAAIRRARAAGLTVNVDRCRGIIFQAGRAKIWETSFEELAGLEADMEEALDRTAALEARPLTLDDHNPGPWCKWCRGKPDCPAFHELGLDIARQQFADLPDVVETTSLQTITPDKAAEVLQAIAQFSLWSEEAVQVLTDRAVREGLDIPGFKLVESPKQRKWKDPATVQEDLIRRIPAGKKIGQNKITLVKTDVKLLSPAQLEKVFPKGSIDDLWETPRGEPRLVTEDTRGKAWQPDAETVFAEDPEEPSNG